MHVVAEPEKSTFRLRGVGGRLCIVGGLAPRAVVHDKCRVQTADERKCDKASDRADGVCRDSGGGGVAEVRPCDCIAERNRRDV